MNASQIKLYDKEYIYIKIKYNYINTWIIGCNSVNKYTHQITRVVTTHNGIFRLRNIQTNLECIEFVQL